MKKLLKRLAMMVLAITLVFGVAQFDSEAATKYKINGVSVSVNSFDSSPNECWVYANNLYYKIWGVQFTNEFGHSSNSLRKLRDKDLTLTPEHLKSFVTNAPLGSVLRVCDKQYLHGTDGWGHSQIIVQKDENGFTVLEGGLSNSPYKREHYYTWSGYCNSRWPGKYQYIKYIKWPGAEPYYGPKGTLTASFGLEDSNVTLKWTSYWDYTDEYVIKRATGTDGVYTTMKIIKDGSKTWTDTDVEPGTAYSYKVVPYDSRGNEGNHTNTLALTTRGGLSSESVSSATPSITLNWTKVAGYSAKYQIYRSTSANGEWTKVAEITDGDTLTWSDTDIESGQIYYYKVLPVNDNGKAGSYSVLVSNKAMKLAAEPFNGTVSRVYGSSRYKTAYQAADALKAKLGVDKFDTVLLATGDNFADALSGSYLAYVKKAPILLTNKGKDIGTVKAYLAENLSETGTVYILGGNGAISETAEQELSGYNVIRLSGSSRYETNLRILEAAGVTDEDIIVCTGKNYADSLSASAVKRPILLVGDTLSTSQTAYLESLTGDVIYIAGGTGAVNDSIESALGAYGFVERLSGKNRYATSVSIAEQFYEEIDAAVIAYGGNFPDGLCGGPLAASMDAPLLITAENTVYTANEYVKAHEVTEGVVLGGSAALTDLSVKVVFDMCVEDVIVEKKYQ